MFSLLFVLPAIALACNPTGSLNGASSKLKMTITDINGVPTNLIVSKSRILGITTPESAGEAQRTFKLVIAAIVRKAFWSVCSGILGAELLNFEVTNDNYTPLECTVLWGSGNQTALPAVVTTETTGTVCFVDPSYSYVSRTCSFTTAAAMMMCTFANSATDFHDANRVSNVELTASIPEKDAPRLWEIRRLFKERQTTIQERIKSSLVEVCHDPCLPSEVTLNWDNY